MEPFLGECLRQFDPSPLEGRKQRRRDIPLRNSQELHPFPG